jgi:hypothetical protein
VLNAAKELLPQIYGTIFALGIAFFRAGGEEWQYHRIKKKLLFIATVG